MPLYEYQCDACGHRFEVIQKFSDPPVGTCPSCGSPVRKLLSSPAIQFKGTGWYITDYAKKELPAKAAGSDKTETTAEKAETKDKTGKADKGSAKSESAPAASAPASDKT